MTVDTGGFLGDPPPPPDGDRSSPSNAQRLNGHDSRIAVMEGRVGNLSQEIEAAVAQQTATMQSQMDEQRQAILALQRELLNLAGMG